MSEDLRRRASAAVELAKAAGADDVWTWVDARRQTECTTRNGELEQMRESNSWGLSLRLWVDGR
jgi:predicted Zn-dependent protease